MSLSYWLIFVVIFTLGVILVQVSHGKLFDLAKLNLSLSPAFLTIIRYIGLFIIIYSSYGVIIDYVIFT